MGSYGKSRKAWNDSVCSSKVFRKPTFQLVTKFNTDTRIGIVCRALFGYRPIPFYPSNRIKSSMSMFAEFINVATEPKTLLIRVPKLFQKNVESVGSIFFQIRSSHIEQTDDIFDISSKISNTLMRSSHRICES